MNLALTVLEIVAPVFILAAVGFGWVRLGFEFRLEFVTRLAMTVAVPCLIFVALMETDLDPGALADLSLAALAAYVLVALMTWIALRILRLDMATYLAPLTFGNTGNLGLPLALFAFGDEGLGYAVVVFAIMAILSFTLGIRVVAGAGSTGRVLREPLLAATVLGGLFLWQGWETPTFLTNTLRLVGQMAIPLMLLTLGVAIARLEVRAMGRALALAALKGAICVGAAVAAQALWPLPRSPRQF